MRPRLAISFSGGRTSAVMTKLLYERLGNTHDIICTFANTGCEHEATLRFVKKCDDWFNFQTVWMEAVFSHGERVGPRPKIVSFDNASRKGEPFEDFIKKHGIPNQQSPQCTSKLKQLIMEYYIRKIRGWKKGSYETAIGIRSDEADRMSSVAKKEKLIYPLVGWEWTKEKILHEVATWPFDLELPGEHYGNCVWCWKKSFRKLYTLANSEPELFAFPAKMEQKYAQHKASTNEGGPGRRVFFRGNLSTEELLRKAHVEKFVPYTDSYEVSGYSSLDENGGSCGETCEIGEA